MSFDEVKARDRAGCARLERATAAVRKLGQRKSRWSRPLRGIPR